MRIYTGYFAKCNKYREAGLLLISTATKIPIWEHGKGILEFKQLGPTPDMLKLFKHEYEPRYYSILNKLDASVLVKYLERISKGKDVVLLCYESAASCEKGTTYCHRHMLSKWIKEKTGVDVTEYEFTVNGNKQEITNQPELF